MNVKMATDVFGRSSNLPRDRTQHIAEIAINILVGSNYGNNKFGGVSRSLFGSGARLLQLTDGSYYFQHYS